MRRYVTTSIFTAIIACSIGIYYVQASFERLPQFRLITTSGDEKEGEHIVLEGGYLSGVYMERLEVAYSGSRYESEQSSSNRMRDYSNGYRLDPAIDRLIGEFPNFMRGIQSADYQDDEVVIRAELMPVLADNRTVDYILKFDILDKTNQKARKMNSTLSELRTTRGDNALNVPRFNGRSLLDVQRIGDVLKVAVYLEQLNEDGQRTSSSVRIFDIDWLSGQVNDSLDMDYDMRASEGQEIRMSRLQEFDWMQPNPQLVLDVTVMEANEANRSTNASNNHGSNTNAVPATEAVHRLKPVQRQLAIYDYASGQVNVIPLTLDSPDQASPTNVYQIGPYALHVIPDETGVKVSSYRLTDATKLFERSWTKEKLQVDAGIASGIASPKRLYLKFESEGTPNVVLIDPAGGEFTYRGAVALDDVEEDLKVSMLKHLNMGPVYYEE